MVDPQLEFWSKAHLEKYTGHGTQQESISPSGQETSKLASLRRLCRSMKNVVSLCGILEVPSLAGPNYAAYAVAEQLNDPFPPPCSARVQIDPKTAHEPKPFEPTINSAVDQYATIFSDLEQYLTLLSGAPSPDASLLSPGVVVENRTTIMPSIPSADVIPRPPIVPSIGRIPSEIYTAILILAYPGIGDPWGAPLQANQPPLSHRLVNRQFASIIGELLPALTFKNPRHFTLARLAHLQQTILSRLLAGKHFNSISIHVPKITHGDSSVDYALRLDLDLWQARLFYVTSLMIPWSQSVYLDMSELDHTHIGRNPSRVFEQQLDHMRHFSWKSRTRLTVPVPNVTAFPFSFLLPPEEHHSSVGVNDFQTTQTPRWKYPMFPWAQLTDILLDCPMSINDCLAVLTSCGNCLRSLTLVGVNEGYKVLVPSTMTNQSNIKQYDSLQSLSISASVDLVPLFERFMWLGLQSLSISLPKPSIFFDFPTILEFDNMSNISWHSIIDLELHCNFTLESALRLVNLCVSLQNLVWEGEILADYSPPVQIASNIVFLKISSYSFNHVEFTERLIKSSSQIISLEAPSLPSRMFRGKLGLSLRHLTLFSPVTLDLCFTVLSTFQVLTTANFAIVGGQPKESCSFVPVHPKQLKSLVFRVNGHDELMPLLSSLQVNPLTLLYIYLECVTEQSLEDLLNFTAHSGCSPECLYLNDVQLMHCQPSLVL